MFIKPSKIKRNKILRNRTISFETPKKTHGNMVIILSDDQDAILKTIDSKLFRPMQLLAFYTPRRIKAVGKSPMIVNQKDYYREVREKTHGRIKRAKTLLSTYNGINVAYDVANEYRFIDSVFEERHIAALRRQTMLTEFMKKKIDEVSSNGDYTNTYLVFPLTKPYPKNKLQRIFISSTDRTTFDPLFLFLKSLEKGIPAEYKNVDLVLFYLPDSDITLALDLKSDKLEAELKGIRQKLRRLNNYLDGEDDLSDELAESDAEEANIEDEETRLENTKEMIKTAVLTKVAKTIDAKNLTDFEAATSQEQDVMIEIDKKVDDFLEKPENLSKSISDLATAIETDNDVKEKALRYVENKKAAATRLNTLAKGLEKETEIINSIEDLKDDGDKTIKAATMKTSVKDMDERVDQSVLGSIDEEYNNKQMREDIINVVSAFSNNEFSPMTIESLNFEDTSDYQNARETMHVKYKTDDNKQVSFTIDIPKIVDKRFFFLSGGKKFIKKQLLRLPIVKTKTDRVEIVTAVNKMTFERSSGKLSRRNEYLLKKLRETKNHPGFTIEYSDNSLINSKLGYSNDFEYEELACSIGKITSGKFQLIFNRDEMKDEIFILDIPDNFINNKRTPIGFINLGDEHKALIYIESEKIYAYNIETKQIMQLADSLFGFLVNTVLKLDMSKLPTIGRSFVFTCVKYLGVTYPLLSVLGSEVGLTNLLKRYRINYYVSKKPKRNVNYVEVKFKDNYLYYEDTIRNTLLLNSIYLLHPEEYQLFKFDGGEPYTDYFCRLFGRSIGQHSRTRLRMNLGVMLDPITHEILLDLKQPSNIIDMCLQANSLLVGNQYKMINDIHNYRVRSNEVVASVLYRIIAEAYVNYQEHKMNGNPINLSIPRGLLIKELLSLQNINDKSTLNPFLEAEQIAQISAKGEKGINLDKAYTNEMRVVDESINGFISGNSTPYSGSAGITRALVYDPKINSVRGYIPEIDEKTLSATNLLSPTELLSPFTAAQADPPRQA